MHQREGVPIRALGCRAVPIDTLDPVGIGAPGRALQDETGSVPLGDVQVGAVVVDERIAALRVVDEWIRGEVGQIPSLVKHEGGLESAVGQKQSIRELRKPGVRRSHGVDPFVRASLGQGWLVGVWDRGSYLIPAQPWLGTRHENFRLYVGGGPRLPAVP